LLGSSLVFKFINVIFVGVYKTNFLEFIVDVRWTGRMGGAQ